MKRRTKVALGLIVVVAVAGGAYAAVKNGGSSDDGVKTVDVERGDIVDKALAVGRIEPEIEVSFDIDANGIVSVSARDLATAKEQSITVSSTGTLSDAEIDEIIEEHDLYEVQLKD